MTEVQLVQLTKARFSRQVVSCLGPWCEGRGDVLVHDIMDFSVDEVVALRKQAYQVALSVLSQWLNDVHKLHKSERFWETMLFRFLNLYLDDVICRYLFMRKAVPSLPQRFAALDGRDYWTPESDRSVLEAYDVSDQFNLQLFSQIAEGARWPSSSLRIRDFEFPQNVKNPRHRNLFQRWIRNAAKRIVESTLGRFRMSRAFASNEIALLPSLFTASAIQELETGTTFRFATPQVGYVYEANRPVDSVVRSTLPVDSAENEFERCVLMSLRSNLPKDYVENFPDQYSRAKRLIRRRGVPKHAFGSFLPNALERVWLAECVDRGCYLSIAQHGGVYGESRRPFWQESEARVANEYLSWGWTKVADVPTAKVRPMPGIRLLRARRTIGMKRNKLLFVLRTNYRYPKFMYSLRISAEADQSAFARMLPESIRRNLVVRLRADSFSLMNLQGTWVSEFPEISVDATGSNIYEQIDQSEIVIIDYLFSTTFAECVSANVPVIVFSSDQGPYIHPDARACFEELRRVGVVHDSPTSAARVLAAIHGQVEEWWNERDRAQAVKSFRDMYARTTPNGLTEWKSYFESLVSPERG